MFTPRLEPQLAYSVPEMDDQEYRDMLLGMQRTLVSLHSRTLGDDLHELASRPLAQGERAAEHDRNLAVRALLHAVTDVGPISAVQRLAGRVRASRSRSDSAALRP